MVAGGKGNMALRRGKLAILRAWRLVRTNIREATVQHALVTLRIRACYGRACTLAVLSMALAANSLWTRIGTGESFAAQVEAARRGIASKNIVALEVLLAPSRVITARIIIVGIIVKTNVGFVAVRPVAWRNVAVVDCRAGKFRTGVGEGRLRLEMSVRHVCLSRLGLYRSLCRT